MKMSNRIISTLKEKMSVSALRIHCRKHNSMASPVPNADKGVKLIEINVFVPHERLTMKFHAKLNSNLRTLVDENDDLKMFLECACGGNAICSTCHVHVVPEFSKKLDPPEEMELDILDLVHSYDDRSRLGCQIIFNEECDGITLIVPESVNNLL